MNNNIFHNQRILLKKKLFSSGLYLLLDIFLIIWIFKYVPKINSKPIYLAEKVWFLTMIFSQLLNFSILFFAALHAYMNPLVLLNENLQKINYKLYIYSYIFQGVIVLSVVFIDVFQYVFILADCKFTGGEPDQEEISLNIIIRVQ